MKALGMTLLNVYVWPDHAARPQVCPGHATQALYTCGICTPFFFFFFVFHVYAQKFLSIVWFLKTTLFL